MRVFEWGSGGSTLWFAQRAASVVSIEHNLNWHDRVYESLQWSDAKNVTLHYELLGPSYWLRIHMVQADFVLIDGRHRKACAEQVKQHTYLPAAILWDDAQRDWYQCGMHFDGYEHRDFLDTEHPRISRLFVRTDGPLVHWLKE